MNYFGAILFFLLPMYIIDSLMAYIAYLLAGRKMPYRKVFVLQIPAALIQSIAYSAFVIIGHPPDILLNFLFMSFFSVADIVIPISWVYFLFRDTNKKKRFFYVSTVCPFYILANYGANTLIGVMSSWKYFEASYSDVAGSAYMIFLLNFAPFFLVFGCVAAIIRLVSKTSFWNKLQAFGNYPKLYLPMGIIYFLFYIVIRIIGVTYQAIWMVPGISLSYFVMLCIVVLMVSDIKRTENLNATQSLLLQQQSYINKLETIQQEIRSIQHDYKNMLSGLYAQASEGNAEAVKEYIDTKLLRVDETVRENLSQMNQLTRIEIPELKGLVLTKMLEAERDQVPFHLEVMFPISRTPMVTEDLLRCVGILLDNAIEEARTRQGSTVTLLLLQEDDTLTVVVKNPVQDKPDLARICDEGYSTKGSGRGVGLFNYQNIVRKYPNATQETKIDGEHFVQVLVLAGNR